MSRTVYLPGGKYNVFDVSFGFVLGGYNAPAPLLSAGVAEHLQLKVNLILWCIYEFAVFIIEPSGTVISH